MLTEKEFNEKKTELLTKM
ncbi:hypothetical protein MHI65_001868 [Clostridium botulinum]|nr:hypothetical protein [Clostridium botulinum]WCJ75120.1 hypothetical protein MHB86_001869 [Clostridium botulinum]WCJ78959.1 hypothetical protein MHI66_001869 [Clostridium botulinum]WCJ82799.1 hypothetical protein MHI65_001868 [Clostridium botulinum]